MDKYLCNKYVQQYASQERGSKFTLKHIVIGIFVRVKADAADGRGQQAHFVDVQKPRTEGTARCRLACAALLTYADIVAD